MKVRCIDASGFYNDLVVGRVYDVEEARPFLLPPYYRAVPELRYRVSAGGTTSSGWWRADRFEVVTDAQDEYDSWFEAPQVLSRTRRTRRIRTHRPDRSWDECLRPLVNVLARYVEGDAEYDSWFESPVMVVSLGPDMAMEPGSARAVRKPRDFAKEAKARRQAEVAFAAETYVERYKGACYVGTWCGVGIGDIWAYIHETLREKMEIPKVKP
jgi:hypothetical protein